MPIDINFGALQTPNPFAAFAQGQEVGQQRRQQQARQTAGNLFATDPDKASQLLMGTGDYEAGLTMRKYAQEDRQSKARAGALAKVSNNDYAGAEADSLASGDVETYKAIVGMKKDQREEAKTRADTFASIGLGLKDKPYEQRRAIIQQIKPTLVQQGMDPAAVDAFDPSDENIAGFTAQAMSVKDLIDKANKDRTFGLQQQQFGEAKRHNRAGEGIAARNADTSAYSAQTGRLSYDARKTAGGFGTPGGGGIVPDHDVEVDQ